MSKQAKPSLDHDMTDEIVTQKAKLVLDDSLLEIDDETELALINMRTKALLVEPRPKRSQYLIPMSALSACVITLSLWLQHDNPVAIDSEILLSQQVEVTDVLSEDPEMLDDLEFIYWLSQQNEQS